MAIKHLQADRERRSVRPGLPVPITIENDLPQYNVLHEEDGPVIQRERHWTV
jgi:hypothetical protein